MPSEDEKIFGDIYRIYNEYRWRILEGEDFINLTNAIAACGAAQMEAEPARQADVRCADGHLQRSVRRREGAGGSGLLREE